MKFPPLKIYKLIASPKVPTDVLWDLSILFIVLAVIYFLAIFFFRSKFKKDTADTAMRKKVLAPMVSEFLFYEENSGTKEEKSSYITTKIEIRELIKDKKNEAVLSEILLDLKKDVSGQTLKLLFKLYKDLNLEQQAFAKLKSFRWQKISQGMFELTQMQVVESYSFIKRFINDKRSVVRKQAEISTVTLMHEGISYFLDSTKYSISEWQQLKILEVLSNSENFAPPRFYKWLTSKNKHVVLFALRLIKHYDQNDAEESIIALIRHKNTHIKHEAISCIKKFNFQSSRSTLKAVFWRNNVHIKLAILDTIASFDKKEDIPFLELVDKKDTNFTVKSKALSAINTIYPEYVMPTDGIDDSVLDHTEGEPFVDLAKDGIGNKEAVKESETAALEVKAILELPTPNAALYSAKPNMIAEDNTELHNEFEHVAQFLENTFVAKNTVPLLESQEDASLVTENTMDIEVEITPEEAVLEVADREIINVVTEANDFEFVSEELEPLETKEHVNDQSYESIFKSLFNRADDACKMLLLDEILEIGNEKELPFLASLNNHHNILIKNKALLIKAKLLEKLTLKQELTVLASEELRDTSAELNQEATQIHSKDASAESVLLAVKQQPEKETYKNTNGLMPLEFCFLLGELEIKPAKPFDLFEIEFAPEFSGKFTSSSIKDTLSNRYETDHGLTTEEHKYFQQLLEFPLTKREKFNG